MKAGENDPIIVTTESQLQSIVTKAVNIEIRRLFIDYSNLLEVSNLKDNASIQEISNETGIPVPTLYAYSSQGKLPCRRVGKRLIFSRKQIQSWLETHCKKTSEEILKEADEFLSAKRR